MTSADSPGGGFSELPDGRRVRADEALRLILTGTVSETGIPFFRALVRNVCKALDTAGAWVTEYLPEQRRLRSLAFWMNDRFIEEYEYDVQGTPCQPVIDSASLAHFPADVVQLFPHDPDLRPLGAVSYVGMPFFDTDGTLIGHLAAIDTKPMPREPYLETVMEIFAVRAGTEYRRLRAEEAVRAREQQLSRLLATAMDSVLILDRGMTIARVNPAAERAFGTDAGDLAGCDLRDFLEATCVEELASQIHRLDDLPEGERQLWLPRSLEVRRSEEETFPAEATLSSFDMGGARYYTLILRNLNDRLQAERRIELLTEETEYLRDAVRAVPGSDLILGESAPMRKLLASLSKVAATGATVLILGETGTGKELIARSIHHASPRSRGPLVSVNCAAIPGSLIESELFGHEKGAFTGATSRREGRFSLADGGTIFLDEAGELPLDLQAKLLRVLQEGEFEALGSTRTRKVNVRVIAATNRNMARMVAAGEFREDLYYRLNVFPLRVPPLCERGDDIVLLARAFAERYARRMGHNLLPLGPYEERRLTAYSWPGNVRELQNVIERGIILASGDRIALAAAMPEAAAVAAPVVPPEGSAAGGAEPERILTADEVQQFERANLIRALEATNWKVAGDGGAANLLALPPSTLASRMKSLGIRRPGRG
jgi:PAS domain S-box-containing protein